MTKKNNKRNKKEERTKKHNKKDKFNFYFGIPHSHTSFSSGKKTPEEAFKYAKKKKLDYLIITDHASKLKYKYKSTNKIKKNHRWDESKFESEIFNEKNKSFLALIGFEYSSRGFGHINIYNTNEVLKRSQNNKELLKWLSEESQANICINHPNKSVSNVSFSVELDKYINFIEICNGAPPYKYCRYENIVFRFLDKGWHVGVFNSQDNHKDNWGDTENLTVVISKELSEESFKEAFANRRVYATESRSLKMIFMLDCYWMGSIVDISRIQEIEFTVQLEDKKNSIKEIYLISNGGEIIINKIYKGKKRVKENIVVQKEIEKSWYMLKVIHSNDKIAYSSPIFLI